MVFKNKKSAIITNLLMLYIIALLGCEIYTLLLHIYDIEHTYLMSLSKIVILLTVFALAAMLRMTEIREKAKAFNAKIGDISEKLATEEKLLRDYKNAIDSSAIVSKTDKMGFITYVNDNFCKVTEYSRDELIGETHRLIRHPDNDRKKFRLMWLSILSKRVYKGKIKNLSKSGKTFFVETTISPILDLNGEVKEFIAIMFDITKETLLEERLSQRAAIERDNIYKDELLKAKESFLLIFTHELKTPLNAIIKFSSFVKKNLEREDFHDIQKLIDLLASVKQNGEEMLLCVSNILDAAKLTSDKMIFEESVFDIGELFSDVMQKILPPNDCKCEINIEKSIFIKSDKLRVAQIISNIISNAIKYGNGEICVSITKQKDTFLACIEDNGAGIQNKKLAFEMFGSINGSTKDTNGTGIGLYYSKTLCDKLGFELTLKDASKLPGASFCISGKIHDGN